MSMSVTRAYMATSGLTTEQQLSVLLDYLEQEGPDLSAAHYARNRVAVAGGPQNVCSGMSGTGGWPGLPDKRW
jgi:hypothetical protein